MALQGCTATQAVTSHRISSADRESCAELPESIITEERMLSATFARKALSHYNVPNGRPDILTLGDLQVRDIETLLILEHMFCTDSEHVMPKLTDVKPKRTMGALLGVATATLAGAGSAVLSGASTGVAALSSLAVLPFESAMDLETTKPMDNLDVVRALVEEVSTRTEKVTVYYGTNRIRSIPPLNDHDVRYASNGQLGPMLYGTCEVDTLPSGEEIGKIEVPFERRYQATLYGWFTSSFGGGGLKAPNPVRKDLSVIEKPQEQFEAQLTHQLSKAYRSEAYIFIHGYRNSFEGACRKVAQIARHLPTSRVPILFSWPSRNEMGPLAYFRDGATIDDSKESLIGFIDLLTDKVQIYTLHAIAHSMGSRGIIPSLEAIARYNSNTAPQKNKLKELVLVAPDISANSFPSVAGWVIKTIGRMTIYASSHDKALMTARGFTEIPRVGELGEHLTRVMNIDRSEVVDVSNARMPGTPSDVTGHDHLSERRVIEDIGGVMDGKAPRDRLHLMPSRSQLYSGYEFLNQR